MSSSDDVIVFEGPVPDTPGGDYVGSRNYPLRGGKHSIWEGGTRGTAFVWSGSATGLIPANLAGKPVMALMHGVDWSVCVSVYAHIYSYIYTPPEYMCTCQRILRKRWWWTPFTTARQYPAVVG